MLSICIPIYNYDVTSLVTDLYLQATQFGIPFEIICIDDCSDHSFRSVNKPICIKFGKYIQLENNIGRSKIRNLFLNFSQFKYLLFLDCDSIIISNNFITDYCKILKENNPQVICGGRIYDKTKPARNKRLRWKYGMIKESQTFDKRQLNPNKSFMTNNFVINREIFEKLKFDEGLSKYGHEDTLFGFQLKINNVEIINIDNPVLNGDLEDNSAYIKKTEAGLLNLIYVLESTGYDPEIIEDITILKYYNKCKLMHLTGLIIAAFTILKPLIKYFLSIGFANLFLFDFYKLGYISLHMKKK